MHCKYRVYNNDRKLQGKRNSLMQIDGERKHTLQEVERGGEEKYGKDRKPDQIQKEKV